MAVTQTKGVLYQLTDTTDLAEALRQIRTNFNLIQLQLSGIPVGSGGSPLVNPMTTANDMIVGGTGGSPKRLASIHSGVLVTSAAGVVLWLPANGTATDKFLHQVSGSQANWIQLQGSYLSDYATAFVNSLAGTAHQVIVSASAGAVTLSTPQNIDTTSTPTFAGAILTGGLVRTVTTPPAGAYSILVTDWSVRMDVSGGGANATLPAASAGTIGQSWRIYKIDNSGNTITLVGQGGNTVSGTTTLTAQWGYLDVVQDTATSFISHAITT